MTYFLLTKSWQQHSLLLRVCMWTFICFSMYGTVSLFCPPGFFVTFFDPIESHVCTTMLSLLTEKWVQKFSFSSLCANAKPSNVLLSPQAWIHAEQHSVQGQMIRMSGTTSDDAYCTQLNTPPLICLSYMYGINFGSL